MLHARPPALEPLTNVGSFIYFGVSTSLLQVPRIPAVQFAMYEQDMQPVLRCGHCHKPFDKGELDFCGLVCRTVLIVVLWRLESTLKRHGYYCRSRRVGSAPRTRSCISCAKAKARCDNRQPECSRCLSKAIKCQYPAYASKRTATRNQRSEDGPIQYPAAASSLTTDHPNVDNPGAAGHDDNLLVNAALDISDGDFADLGPNYLDPDLAFDDFFTTQTATKGIQDSTLELSFLEAGNSTSQNPDRQTQLAIYSPDVSIPPIPTLAYRSFDQRPRLKSGSQRITNLILHTLKSYPLMMLHDNNLPPFIHPHFALSDDPENSDVEPLTNCINLVHMRSSRIHGSRKLFWKNVRMECERLCAEVICDPWRYIQQAS